MQMDKLLDFIVSFPAGSLEQRCLVNALELAKICHEGQKRKITNEDYIVHPVEVAEILLDAGISDVPTIAAALLHDVIEDCQLPARATIRAKCGPLVESYVLDCTNSFDSAIFGRRAVRKAKEADRLAKCTETVQNIKLADAISNLRTIGLLGEEFSKIYANEKLQLARKLHFGHRELRKRAIELALEVLK